MKITILLLALLAVCQAPCEDLMNLTSLVSSLSTNRIFYPQKLMQESSQVYTLQILQNQNLQKNQLGIMDISADVVQQFEKWQSTFLKPAMIRHFAVEKLIAFKDLVLFETRLDNEELIFSWESDLIFWANQAEQTFYCWDSGTVFALCIPGQLPDPLTRATLQQYLQELLLENTNFPELLITVGIFEAHEARQLWRGFLADPELKIQNWQSRIEWIAGADFVCFFFFESDEPPRMRNRPGAMDRF